MRIGHGYDVHRLRLGRQLILGGVKIPSVLGLDGHSDADVLTHAVMDALLGAMGGGDIGQWFPDSDAQYKGISSLKLLAVVKQEMDRQGFTLENLDATVVAQGPKLAGFLPEMRQNLAAVLETEPERINLKATTEEHLGFTGAGEGMAAHAVCLLHEGGVRPPCHDTDRGQAACRLRKWQLSDAADLAASISNRNVQDRLRDGLPYPYAEQDARAYISAVLAADEEEQIVFAIDVDGRAVGNISVERKGNVHRRTAELGYYLAEEYWGRGIMPAAVRQICQYVFSHTDILRIFAEPYADNAASCRVLEKAGFEYEGTLRSNAVKNGKVLDMKVYARLAP